VIPYDFTNDTHDTYVSREGANLTTILVNGTVWRKIYRDVDNYTTDFFLQETYNTSIISYNVIGTLKGKDTSKTVLVDCLYDSVWCQAAGDSAIGMGIVMGIAKYFTDHNITPRYTMKFIGFGGEEVGCLGAKYYESFYKKNETIVYVIDMNQVCADQTNPPLTLNVIFNSVRFMREL
jgi:Zn-dependent M28 family amino/carboxypeptidase